MTTTTEGPLTRPVDPGPTRRRRHTARWVSGGVALVLVVVAVVAATRPSAQASSVASPLIGRQAPPLAAIDFGGQRASLAQDRGKFVVIDFFASWCPPCMVEEQHLAQFAFVERQKKSNVALLSVDIDDSTAGGRRFVAEWGVSWPAIPDHAGQYATEYGVGSPPMTFLVDPRGRVVAVFAGPMGYGQLTSMLAVARRG